MNGITLFWATRIKLQSVVLSFCLFHLFIAVGYSQEANKLEKIEAISPNIDRPIRFDKDIQPILDDKCVACHNVAVAESKLILEDVPSILKGGKRGPAIIPRDAESSLLYQLAARAANPVMPPIPNTASATAFTPQELGLLKQWINEGATGGISSPKQEVSWQSIPSGLRSIYCVALSRWGRWAACGRANQIDLYDISSGEFVTRLQDSALLQIKKGEKLFYPDGGAHRDSVRAIAFNPTGDLLASASYREVKLWQRSTNNPINSFPQDQTVTSIVASPDGQWLAVGRSDHSCVLQHISDSSQHRVIAQHRGPVTAVRFTADSKQLITGSTDKTIRAWKIPDGQMSGIVETPYEVSCLAFNLDETLLFSGHNGDHVIRGWKFPLTAATLIEGENPADVVKSVIEMRGHEGSITAIELLRPNGSQLVSSSSDATWRVWDISTGNQVRSHNHGAAITSMSLKQDGQFVATVGANKTARLWKIDGAVVAELKGNIETQRKVAGATDNETVEKSRVQLADIACKAAEKYVVESAESTKKAVEQKAAAEKVLTEAMSNLEAAVASAEAAKTELDTKPDDEPLKKKKTDADSNAAKKTEAVKKARDALDAATKAITQCEKGQQSADDQRKQYQNLLDIELNAEKQIRLELEQAKNALVSAENKGINAVTFVGHLITAAGEDGKVFIWNGSSGKPLEEIVGHSGPIGRLVSGANRQLVAVADEKQVIVWDSNPEWKLVATMGPPTENTLDLSQSQFVNSVLALAFSPNSQLLATGGGEPSRTGELILWNIQNRKIVHSFADAHSDTVVTVDFSRDGKYLASGAADKFVKQFDVETGKHIRSFEGHTHHVLGVSWKGDGSRIASAGADNAIKIWNVATGEQHRTIQNHAKQVTAVQFIGITDNLVSGSGDKSVKLHRSIDGSHYRTFTGSTDYVYAVSATPDEGLIAAGGEDGIFRIWNGSNAQELHKFEDPKRSGGNTQMSSKP